MKRTRREEEKPIQLPLAAYSCIIKVYDDRPGGMVTAGACSGTGRAKLHLVSSKTVEGSLLCCVGSCVVV